MNQISIVLISTLLLAPSVFANSKVTLTGSNQQVNLTQSQKEILAFKEASYNDSMGNRMDKRFTFNAGVLGYDFGASSSSIEVGFHLDINTILSAQYTTLTGNQSRYSASDEAVDIYTESGAGHALRIGLKSFVSNSFYVKPELYNRVQDNIYNIYTEYSTITDDYYIDRIEKGSIEDLGVSFKIGNQWQWKNFTMGCDWVGINRSITNLKKTGKKSSTEEITVSALSFYLGSTF